MGKEQLMNNIKYIRKEPTNDEMRQYKNWRPFLDTKRDVVVYNDENCTDEYARFPWHYKESKPTRKNKYVIINGYRWSVVWLEDLKTLKSD